MARKYFSVMFASDYTVLCAADAQEAWQVVQEHGSRLAVIITDQRMAGHSGVDLLMAVRQQYPAMMRMLTTGFADLGEAIDAVNRGDIHAYIPKPWNIEEFSLEIARAVGIYDLQRERDSLLDSHTRGLRRALAADRLRTYGMIAATCGAWLHRPLEATVDFWSDSRRCTWGLGAAALSSGSASGSTAGPRLGLPTQGWPNPVDDALPTAVHNRAMIACAADFGSWLTAHHDDQGPEYQDTAALLWDIAGDWGCECLGALPACHLRVNSTLLSAGIHQLFEYLTRCAALADMDSELSMRCEVVGVGDLHIQLQAQWSPQIGPSLDLTQLPALLAAENAGLKAYLAVYHHGGRIEIAHWDRYHAQILIHLPRRAIAARPDAMQQLHGAIQGIQETA